jgi:hypothetical protein
MKQIIIILIFGFSLNLSAQITNTDMLIALGDSVLKANIGDLYSSYYHLDSNSYFKTNRKVNGLKKHGLIPNKKIRGDFKEASVRFTIHHPDFIDLKSTFYIVINSNSETEVYPTDTPEFILNNKSYNFLDKNQIVKIGEQNLNEIGQYIKYYLHKDFETKEFIWEINNIIRDCNESKFMDGLMEIIIIEPYQGKILKQEVVNFGHVF